MRASIKSRQEAGLHFGRPPVFQMRGAHCKACGSWFRYKFYPDRKRRTACSPSCAAKIARETRRLIPEDFQLLYDLYWNQNMSTPEIAKHFGAVAHKPVRQKMIALGIPRRKPGHSRITFCVIDDCDFPVYRIKHSNNGSLYGRRCLLHWVAHRKQLASEYWLKIRRWRRHNLGTSGETDMEAIINDVVPRQLPYEIRDEVCQEIALQLLLRKTHYSNLREAVTKLTKRFFREYQNKFGDLSLDAPINEEGLTLGEILEG